MSQENTLRFPLMVRVPHYPAVELWRMALRGDDAARRELLRRIMPAAHAPEQSVVVRPTRKAS